MTKCSPMCLLFCRRTAPDFSVTMSAVSKTYHFSIDTNSEHDPITYRFRMHVPKPLDLEALREALAMIRVRVSNI